MSMQVINNPFFIAILVNASPVLLDNTAKPTSTSAPQIHAPTAVSA